MGSNKPLRRKGALPNKNVTGKEQRFCEEYIIDFNASRAAIAAGYKSTNYEALRVKASQLLKFPHVRDEIIRLQQNLEEAAGLSKLMVLLEHKKIAFGSIAELHDSWIERKAFDKLTDQQKSCIQEIITQTRTMTNEDGESSQVEFVKIKLFDKQRSLDSISKMLGYDAPTKIDLTSDGKALSPPQIIVYNEAPPLANSEDAVIDITPD